MKHIKRISSAPRRAQSATPGQILSVVSQLLTVFAQAFLAKEGTGAAPSA